ncbi:hypothetical protein HZB88_03130 [archaeon]|nr:hypothetical protein [archaeon]
MRIYDQEAIGCINLFEKLTKANVKDAIINSESITFFVFPNQRRLALLHLGILKSKIKKYIIIKEFNPDAKRFMANLLYPIRPKNITIEGKMLKITANSKIEKGKIFGDY